VLEALMRLFSVRSAPSRPSDQTFPVLRLTVTVDTDQAGQLPGAVAARLADCECRAATVVLTIDGDPPADDTLRDALDVLQRSLRALGARLALVPGAGTVRKYLEQAGPEAPPSPLAVYPTERSAVLASYAELIGPGLVTGAIRAALTAPAEPLVLGGPAPARPGRPWPVTDPAQVIYPAEAGWVTQAG
jgi:hypothetical protein